MDNFADNTRLLNKRCDYLEAQMRFNDDIPETPPEGYQYKHFVLHGVTSAYSQDAGKDQAYSNQHRYDVYFPARIGGHMRELFVVTNKKHVTRSMSAAELQASGVNPANYGPLSGIGRELRSTLASQLASGYHKYFSLGGGYDAGKVGQVFLGHEIAPSDPAASWADQQQSLLAAARAKPLRDLLGQQHIVATQGHCYGWSARKAGFPAVQFEKTAGSYESYQPYGPPRDVQSSLQFISTYNRGAVRSCPTVVLVTVAVPDNYDAIVAGEVEGSVEVTFYYSYILTPHWIGRAQYFHYGFHGSDDPVNATQKAYDPDQTYNYANQLGFVGFHDAYSNTDASVFGDFILYTPADLADTYRGPQL